ncbi:hypothetical protein [Chryseosolibacter indicus]|uniref:PKD domain-containing protein n=1 Tax=Chryseosolibacter indicus TaxID=2782351 RepID=A0ABS5VW47_9BACT|nr:hypothetical protein [Chryseosolibacter indicus]MBT1705050.1 hypothetical protein [Chryseosolibacter indicus]
MPEERDYIVLYRTLTEKKYFPGKQGEKLKQRDFEYLIEQIEGQCKVRLSVSTLKRIWKDSPNLLPHPSTLDALVSLLDYKDWHSFKKDNIDTPVIDSTTVQHITSRYQKNWIVPATITSGILLLTALFFIIQGFKSDESKQNFDHITFKAEKTVTHGVPNTVQFFYDLKNVNADTFFIQQSWNPRDKVQIDPNKKYHSAVYYTPGFHFARIIADGQIVKFEKVHILTDGWFPIVKYDLKEKVPIYPDKNKTIENGLLKITREELKAQHINIERGFYLRYYNIRDFKGITSSTFKLETRIKCDSTTAIACPEIELMIATEGDVFWVPITSKGCVSNLNLKVGESYRSAKDTNLSGLGSNVYEWQDLNIVNNNKDVKIYLNHSLAFEVAYEKDFGDIKGLIFTFTGTGSVDYVRLKDLNDTTIYNDDFMR